MTNRSQVLHEKAARLQLAIAVICVNHGAAPSWIVCISMGSDQYLVIKADFTFFGAFYFPAHFKSQSNQNQSAGIINISNVNVVPKTFSRTTY